MSKIYDGIIGLVVGDALGVPVEFKKRDTFQITDMVGYGTYNQPPGTWSDDSSMTIATLYSLTNKHEINPDDIMLNFFRWLDNGDFTPEGFVFDVGNTTRQAIFRFANGRKPLNCGGKSRTDNGNGALMRILPLAFIPHTSVDVKRVAGLTHAHEISQISCRLYVQLAEMLLKGNDLKYSISFLGKLPPVRSMDEFKRIARIGELSRDKIRSSGYVVDTLEAALWCLWNTSSYRDCVLAAVNLGEDTDTVAAVAGGIAGIVYGCYGKNGIPVEWIMQIPRKEWIHELCSRLEKY